MFQNQRLKMFLSSLLVHTTEKWVQNIVGQIEKQIEVIKTFIILMKKRSFRKCNIQNRFGSIIR
jgi:hypothetical protein